MEIREIKLNSNNENDKDIFITNGFCTTTQEEALSTTGSLTNKLSGAKIWLQILAPLCILTIYFS